MRVYDNGVYRDMTQEEIEEFEKEMGNSPPPEPTPEEKIEELKSQVTALQAEILKIGGNI